MNVPDNDKQNQEQFLEILRQVDPELYLIKQTLIETKVNPIIVRQVLRSIGNLSLGTGFGKIEIYMQAKSIKNIKGIENILIEEEES